MATLTASILKVRQILQLLGSFTGDSENIANASSGATQIVLSTMPDARHFLNGDTLFIADDDANELNAATADGVGGTGVVTCSALSNLYDASPYIQKVEDELLSDTVIQALIGDAVELYSKHRPRLRRQEVIGNSEHEIALPSDWLQEFSNLMRIEYPSGAQAITIEDSNDYQIVYVDNTNRTISNASSGATSVTAPTAADAGYFRNGEIVTVGDDDATETNWVSANGNTTTGVIALKNALANTYDATPYIVKLNHLHLMAATPTSSDYFTLEYNGQHTHTDSTDTILNNDYEALTHLMAAICGRTIQAVFAKKQMSTMDADAIDFGAKADAWSQIAVAQRQLYNDHMGLGGDVKVKGSSFVGDMDSRYSWGRNWLTHARR